MQTIKHWLHTLPVEQREQIIANMRVQRVLPRLDLTADRLSVAIKQAFTFRHSNEADGRGINPWVDYVRHLEEQGL